MSKRKPKITLELIADSVKRSGVFFRRRGGIMKKAFELAKLCGVHVGVVITDLKGHVHTYKTNEKIRLSASGLLDTQKMAKKKIKFFEYSSSDYPFTRVYNMSREIRQLDFGIKSSKFDPGEPLLKKRKIGDSFPILDKFPSIVPIEPQKHLKIEKIAQNHQKMVESTEKNFGGNSSKFRFKELNASQDGYNSSYGYKYDHFHSINLKKIIRKLEQKTHKMAKKFGEKGQRIDYLNQLKHFHKFSNEYMDLSFDIHFEEHWFWRVIIASYFSENDSLLIRSLRKIPLNQICELMSLWRLQKPKNSKNFQNEKISKTFIETLILHLEVILLIITDRITIDKDFSISKEAQKSIKPVKYLAFKKWMRKRCGYLKTVYAISSTGFGSVLNISDNSTHSQAPKGSLSTSPKI